MKRVLTGLLGLAVVACAPGRRDDAVPAGAGPLIVVYKASIDDGDGVKHGAKLLVWAEDPDRLHAELVAPVGGVTFILDAGGGQACIVDVAAATAYVGDDGPRAIEALVGVRVSAVDAVAALLHGAAPKDLVLSRVGEAEGVLPETLRIADGDRSIALSRIRFERAKTGSRTLGTGLPPDGLRLRPIDDLASEAGRPGGGR